jgi:hypothetical protein
MPQSERSERCCSERACNRHRTRCNMQLAHATQHAPRRMQHAPAQHTPGSRQHATVEARAAATARLSTGAGAAHPNAVPGAPRCDRAAAPVHRLGDVLRSSAELIVASGCAALALCHVGGFVRRTSAPSIEGSCRGGVCRGVSVDGWVRTTAPPACPARASGRPRAVKSTNLAPLHEQARRCDEEDALQHGEPGCKPMFQARAVFSRNLRCCAAARLQSTCAAQTATPPPRRPRRPARRSLPMPSAPPRPRRAASPAAPMALGLRRRGESDPHGIAQHGAPLRDSLQSYARTGRAQ